jgi:hypothetical protein
MFRTSSGAARGSRWRDPLGGEQSQRLLAGCLGRDAARDGFLEGNDHRLGYLSSLHGGEGPRQTVGPGVADGRHHGGTLCSRICSHV